LLGKLVPGFSWTCANHGRNSSRRCRTHSLGVLLATCFGHLARIHGELDLVIVLPAVRKLQSDPDAGSNADAA